jgi:hypothetical protein
MAVIDNIIDSNITGDLALPAAANFGVVMLVKQFAPFDTTKPFIDNESRHREYFNIDEVQADGWGSTSDVYRAALRLFAQDPNPGKFVLGRKDSGDADWPAALAAVHDEYSGWYGMDIVEDAGWDTATRFSNLKAIAEWVETKTRIFGHGTADEGCINITRAASAGYHIGGTAGTVAAFAVIADGSFGIEIDGAAVAQITALDFTAGPVTSLAEIATVIDTALTGATCAVVGTRLQITSETLDIDSAIEITAAAAGTDISIATLFNIAGGTIVLGYDAGTTPGTDDLFTKFGALGLRRTFLTYNKQEQDGQHTAEADVEWIAIAQMAEAFPFDAASQTWAFKALAGVTVTNITESIMAFVFDPKGATPRSGNVYGRLKGKNYTWKGRMVDGTPVDVVRGEDWQNDLIQTKIWGLVTRTADGARKVPATNPGIAEAENQLRAALTEGSVWFLDGATIVIEVPDIEDIPVSARADRDLDQIKWSGRLQGAFESFKFNGVVYV